MLELILVFFNITLLAVSLSIDAFGVGLVYGLRRINIPFVAKSIICFFSILYALIAVLIGNSLLNIMPMYLSKILGPLILFIMGVYMIVQGFFRKEDEQEKEYNILESEKTLFKFIIKSIGITIHITKSPLSFDMDRSGQIDMFEAILLGLALSIDAIGVGIGSALAGFGTLLIPFAVGIFQMVFLYVGTYLGKRFGNNTSLSKRTIEALPGVLLIIFALIRL